MSREIKEEIKRKLLAESMGRCMNPACQKKLFTTNGNIIEKAHIVPYCKTADNSFENLVVLCPNCHTDFDKNDAFTSKEVLGWKAQRQKELDEYFSIKFNTFDELEQKVVPLLIENKTIYENYYLTGNKELWDKFESQILVNNEKLKLLIKNNLHLFQKHQEKEYSNLEIANLFLLHVDEFKKTRLDEEKTRKILFPAEINSIFGITPVNELLLPMTESLEDLITKLDKENKFGDIILGIEEPYMQLIDNGISKKVFLKDTPRLRQLYENYNCYKTNKVRLDSLNYALKIIKNRKLNYNFETHNNLRVITIKGIKMIFIYEYCVSQVSLFELAPEEGSIVVNLHNWNGEKCISNEAYKSAKKMHVKLVSMDNFYECLSGIKYGQ